jgi:hypothetical protein
MRSYGIVKRQGPSAPPTPKGEGPRAGFEHDGHDDQQKRRRKLKPIAITTESSVKSLLIL